MAYAYVDHETKKVYLTKICIPCRYCPQCGDIDDYLGRVDSIFDLQCTIWDEIGVSTEEAIKMAKEAFREYDRTHGGK